MAKKTNSENKHSDDKVVERLSALQSSIDELSACLYSMNKKVTFIYGMIKNLSVNKPWLFKDNRIRESLSAQQLLAMDKLKYEESKIKDPDDRVSESQFTPESESSN